MRARLWCLGALVVLGRSVHGGDAEEPVRRFRIEVLYTIHAKIDTDQKLDRVRRIVLKAYPEARFAEDSSEERRIYFGTYRDRLLGMAGAKWDDIVKKVGADPDPKKWDDALRVKLTDCGYAIAKDQVNREVALRAVYYFLHSQAKDDVSLKVIFDKLKAKDDPKDPICSTEPGKGLLVYRDFNGKPLSGNELTEIEDSGVKFGISFKPRVTGLGDTDLPKMSSRADTLGDEGHGRQIFRLLEVIPANARPAVADVPWGEDVNGLRCRVRAPSTAAQGDLLQTSVDVGVVRLHGDRAAFDPDLRARGTSLEMVGQDGHVVVVRTYDPYSGMPPDLAPRRIPNPGQLLTESIDFPLATAWDDLSPGAYRCRVHLSYEPRQDGYFRGTLVSPEFLLRVDTMPPHEETFLLPKALRVVERTQDDGAGKRVPVRQVVYGRADAEEVRLPRRNGFFLGTDILRDGKVASVGGDTVKPDAVNPIDSSYGTGPDAQRLGAAYTIVIFETADAPDHGWHPAPGSGGYCELWRRTIALAGVAPQSR